MPGRPTGALEGGGPAPQRLAARFARPDGDWRRRRRALLRRGQAKGGEVAPPRRAAAEGGPGWPEEARTGGGSGAWAARRELWPELASACHGAAALRHPGGCLRGGGEAGLEGGGEEARGGEALTSGRAGRSRRRRGLAGGARGGGSRREHGRRRPDPGLAGSDLGLRARGCSGEAGWRLGATWRLPSRGSGDPTARSGLGLGFRWNRG